jgi:hypothetical protein
VFSCPLKSDAARTIRMLNKSSHRVYSSSDRVDIVRNDHGRQSPNGGTRRARSRNRGSGCIDPRCAGKDSFAYW